MPSLLERETKLDLGSDEETKQPFKTKLTLSRTRGGLPHNTESAGAEGDELGPTQNVHTVETQSNDPPPRYHPLNDDESVIKFFSVLNAPCFFAPRIRRRRFARSLHS